LSEPVRFRIFDVEAHQFLHSRKMTIFLPFYQ